MKESKEDLKGRLWGKRGKGKSCDYIIISKTKLKKDERKTITY